MESHEIVTLGGVSATILVVLYLSDFIYEYGKVLKLNSFLRLDEYQKMRIDVGGQLGYFSFWEIKKPCFLTKLLSCHLCLGFWVTLIFSLFFSLEIFGIAYILSQILFLTVKKLYDGQ